jgi:small-conductance mechanosensitive channel
VIVGNSDLLEKEVYNLQRLNRRRMIEKLALAYSNSDASAAHALDLAREVVEATDACKLVRVGLMGMDKEGLQYELQYDVMSSNYNEVIAARTQVNLAILRRFRDAGIAFADPNGKPQDMPKADGGTRSVATKAATEPAEANPEKAP